MGLGLHGWAVAGALGVAALLAALWIRARRGHGFATPDDLMRFIDEVRAALADSGRPNAAQRLDEAQNLPVSLASDWYAALAEAVVVIRRDGPLPAEIERRLGRILRAVRDFG